MIHIHEKVNKTFKNGWGIKNVTNGLSLKDGPCIITILASPLYLRSINGSLRQVAELINPNIDEIYDPKRRIFGLSFGNYYAGLGMFNSNSPTPQELEEFINNYFIPLLVEEDRKIPLLKAMKNFRNINFVTYCNGGYVFNSIEDGLKEKMKKIGYTKEEIGLILSQVCVAAISGNTLKNHKTSTLAISFGDINDSNFFEEPETIKSIKEKGSGFITYDSSIGFAIDGDGNHHFKKHMTGDPILSSKIGEFLNTSIDNALVNDQEEIMDPISYEKIQKGFDSATEYKKKK